jgi:Domain of unknown function (DUF4167)
VGLLSERQKIRKDDSFMKPNQSNRRSRGRSGPRRPGGPNRGGSGPNKGNAKQQLEKYKSQAREAWQSNDRVLAERLYQHAEHYQRILNEHEANRQNRQDRDHKAKPPAGDQASHVGDPAKASHGNPENIEDHEVASADDPKNSESESSKNDAGEEKPRRKPGRGSKSVAAE